MHYYRIIPFVALISFVIFSGFAVDAGQKQTTAPIVRKTQKTKVVPQKQKKILPTCKPSGCNGEICSDVPVMSPCWVLSEFACYKKANCVRFKNKQCGWVETPALKACLSSKHKPGSLPKSIIPKPVLPMRISSAAFPHNGSIPAKYTCDGPGTNPSLQFSDIPLGTKSFVLLMDDPDVPKDIRPDGMWDHWVVYNIPPATATIRESEGPSGTVGKNSGGSQEYYAPCPPDREHRYFFKLYALDTLLDLPAGSSKAEVEKAMQGHILAQAELIGRYNRQ